jgi:RNA polymerase sigma-70 factor (ECF subfamily)
MLGPANSVSRSRILCKSLLGGKMQVEKDRPARNLESPYRSSPANLANDIHNMEREATRRAQQGDLWGFEQIYRLHSKRIYAQCYRMLGDAAEAEDLTQEVFLQLFRKIKTFRGDSLLSTWLYRVTFNAVLMHTRRRNTSFVSLEQIGSQQLASGLSQEELKVPAQAHAAIADRLYLQKAISQLPWTWEFVFILHDVHGYKHSEIARMMRCSANTSKGLLHKARLRLRSILLADHGALGFVPELSAQPC